MDQETPDFDFLISINENIAAGLSGTALSHELVPQLSDVAVQ